MGAHLDRTAVSRSPFFLWLAIAFAVLVLWGFGPTYFFRAFTTTQDLSLLVHVHGFLFSCWIVLFATQSALAAKGRIDIHRRLGFVGGVFAVAVVGVGIAVDFATMPPRAVASWNALEGSVASFAWLARRNSGNAMIFGLLVAAAVYLRRYADVHKRFMVFATLAILDAPIARVLDEIGWPIVLRPAGNFVAPDGFFNQTLAPLISPAGWFNLVLLPLVLCVVIYDLVKIKRVHWATIVGSIVLFLFQPLAVVLLATDGP